MNKVYSDYENHSYIKARDISSGATTNKDK